VERRGGETIHRCINKKAEAYRQPVDASVCDSCPVRVLLKKNEKRQAPEKVQLPVVDTSDYPPCEFRFKNPADLTPVCGVTGLGTDRDICTRCSAGSKVETKTLFGKAMNYQAAVRRWFAAGRPERTDEEIAAIYDEHCSKCDMYDKVRKICNSCGCPATKDQPALRNKLRMATEACPLGRFPAKVKTNA
jgi:hypothetical protein